MREMEPYQQIMLSKVKFYSKVRILGRELNPSNMELDLHLDTISHNLVATLIYNLYQEDCGYVIHKEEVPKGWFDHFKFRYFPKWMLKRCPIKFKTLEIKVKIDAVYPEFAVQNPQYFVAKRTKMEAQWVEN